MGVLAVEVGSGTAGMISGDEITKEKFLLAGLYAEYLSFMSSPLLDSGVREFFFARLSICLPLTFLECILVILLFLCFMRCYNLYDWNLTWENDGSLVFGCWRRIYTRFMMAEDRYEE